MATNQGNQITALSSVSFNKEQLTATINRIVIDPTEKEKSFLDKMQGVINNSTSQASMWLDGISEVAAEFKPLTTIRLLRNLLDAPGLEHLFYSLCCLYEIHQDWLPCIEDVSVEAIECFMDFMKNIKNKDSPEEDSANPTEEQEGVEEYEAQGFIKKEAMSPSLRRCCERLGLAPEKMHDDFKMMEIPIIVLSGLIGVLSIFCGDKLLSLVVAPKKIAAKLGQTAKLFKDFSTTWQFLEKEATAIINFVAEFFGYTYISDKNVKSKQALDKLVTIMDQFKVLEETCKTDLTRIVQSEAGLIDLKEQVGVLEKEIDELHRNGTITSLHSNYLIQFRQKLNDLHSVINHAKQSAAGKQKPIVLCLAGPAGVGKSELSVWIVKELSRLEGRDLSVYTRNSQADKYWSKYMHEDVVIYDDFNQDKKNQDHSELIGMSTVNTYHLNMAECKDKGIPFTSRYVILCSNFPYVTKSELVNDIEALHRRRDLMYFATCNEAVEYKQLHGQAPPSDSPIWRRDFTHMDLTQLKPIPTPGLEATQGPHNTLAQHVNPIVVVRNFYEAQVIEKDKYQRALELAQRQRISLGVQIDHRNEVVEYVPESINTTVTGNGYFLVHGPSRCGKSYFLTQMGFKRVQQWQDVIDSKTGELKVKVDQNIHFEDISISKDKCESALHLIQVLKDNREFTGNIVFSANTKMLYDKLEQCGEEAFDVFFNRVQEFKIAKRRSFWTFDKIDARKLSEPNSGYAWDDIYKIEFRQDNTKPFTPIKRVANMLITLKEQHTQIHVRAVLDQEAFEDCKSPTILHLPTLDFKTFAEMPDRTDMREYLTSGSMIKALKTLRGYIPGFKSLPNTECTPSQLVEMINDAQIRISAKLPSICLHCSDFKLYLINHQTYMLCSIITDWEMKIPPLDFTPPQHIPNDSSRVLKLRRFAKFLKVVFGGALAIRELFGLNKNGHVTCKVIPGTHFDKSKIPALKEIFPAAVFPESKGQRARQRRQNFKAARSQIARNDKNDPSQGAAQGNTAKQFPLQNESSKRQTINYTDKDKPTQKFLTHTDLNPRETISQLLNCITIDSDSFYHPTNYKYIKMAHEAGTSPNQCYSMFNSYLMEKALDPCILQNEVTFSGLTGEDLKFWTNFFIVWRGSYYQAESMQDQQAAQLLPLVAKNQVLVKLNGILVQRGTMIHDRVGVTPAHGITNECTIEIVSTGQNFPLKIKRCDNNKDIAIFEASPQCPSFRDIRGFIRSRKDNDLLDGLDAVLITVHASKSGMITELRASKVQSRKIVKYDNAMREGFVYSGHLTGFDIPLPSLTEKGHCGSTSILLHSKYQRKILSIHSAGNSSTAFGLPIYAEDFYEDYTKESIGPLPHITTQPSDKLLEVEPISDGEFVVRYELEHNNAQPVQTDIFKSPLNSDYFGDNFEPAILSSYDTRNTEHIDIQHVTIDKWNHKQPEPLPQELLDTCVREIGQHFANIIKREGFILQPLTKTEAINRTTYFANSQPLNLDTSAGYPFKHIPGAVGKKHLIQPRPHKNAVLNCIVDNENGRLLHNAIDRIERDAANGLRPAVVFNSSPKDEVLKKKKIYPVPRTRGITIAPVQYSIAHRRYLHTLYCALSQTRAHHSVKVGIEANGLEWNELYQYLAENSDVGTDMDFKDWDAFIPAQLMECLPKIYNIIYTQNSPKDYDQAQLEKDNRIREGLYKCLVKPLITRNQQVIQSPGGQMSGQPGTTPDNCIIGLIKMFLAWMLIAPSDMKSWSCFVSNVRIANFGDDIIATIKASILDWFNYNTIKKILEETLNVSITTAAKDGSEPPFRPLVELEFLKRNFLKIGPYFYGKIQPSVFDKMLNWTHTHKKHHFYKEPNKIHFELLTIESTIDSMLYELCIYPPKTWNDVTQHLQERLFQLGSRKILPTQTDVLIQRGIPHNLFLPMYKQN